MPRMNHFASGTRESKTKCTGLAECTLRAIGVFITHKTPSVQINLLTACGAVNHLFFSPVTLNALPDVFVFVYWHSRTCTGRTEAITELNGLYGFADLLNGLDRRSHIAYCYTQRLQEVMQGDKIVTTQGAMTVNIKRLIGY